MNRDAPGAPRRRIGPPLGLAGMLALILAVELAIAGRRVDFLTLWSDDWRRAAEATGREARGRDVLCFGDSLVKYAVLPREIEAGSGLTAYNLAVNAGTMPSAYFLLRRTLDHGVRPRAIVADFFALMLPDTPRVSVRMYPELASFADGVDLARASGDPGLVAPVWLGKVWPSFKCRHEIRNSVLAAFRGARASPWPAQGPVWATWKAELGAQPTPMPAARFPADPLWVAHFSPADWACDPINAGYFDRFVALARSRSIPIFWLMPPLGPEIHAARKLRGSDLAYDRFARLAQDRYPGLTVVDARSSGYDETVHIDPIHLDARGAAALSRDLAPILAAHLDGRESARWIAMPPYRPGLEAVAGRPGGGTTRR